jgi:hypothetical protein
MKTNVGIVFANFSFWIGKQADNQLIIQNFINCIKSSSYNLCLISVYLYYAMCSEIYFNKKYKIAYIYSKFHILFKLFQRMTKYIFKVNLLSL